VLQTSETFPPAWRAVIDRHPDRFMFATDINSFGPRYTIAADLMATARKALAPLPRETQELIAHGNVERLLGSCAK
jgi:predicted TIM-barrel fold metal-dependent hydrolase